MYLQNNIFLLLSVSFLLQGRASYNVVLDGPGLKPEQIVMPARYFFLNFTNVLKDINNLDQLVAVEINGITVENNPCRIWTNKLNRRDGTFIIRYKVYETCYNFHINIYFKSKHIQGSPFYFKGPVYADQCVCPDTNFERWLQKYGCPESFTQIKKDLNKFTEINIEDHIFKILSRYNRPESTSFCHYVVKANQIYRNCYGKHVGFNMFSDNILLFLARKVVLPDMELVINLGDWPLVINNSEALAIFSWCGSNDTLDIVMPTYDLTESTIENMGRVSLDILSVQGNVPKKWEERESKAIWRGRDSRAERLKLIDIARKHEDLINASLTNFFFFRDKEEHYGPKQPPMSFFKFFDYKYLINIDGTVAAYRMPYLLAGGGVILKQQSPYYEHFYKDMKPWEHYVPVKRDLSDLVQQIKWIREHDIEAYNIAKNARDFANNNLLPQHIMCYHAVLFKEWSKRIKSEIKVHKQMTHVPQPNGDCDCSSRSVDHEEL